ncbi:MAG: 50S ribosomal protein L18 [Candidatus Limnocylindria bacterium]
MPPTRTAARQRRHGRVREKVRGEAARPRLAVFRSLSHIYAQVIDDRSGRTLVAASTVDGAKGATGSKTDRAKAVGRLLAERAKAAGVTEVVFDRGGYRYHGRVKALADAAREGGMKF